MDIAIAAVGQEIANKEQKWEKALDDGKTDLAAGLDKSLNRLYAKEATLQDQLGNLQGKLTTGRGLCFCLCLSCFRQHSPNTPHPIS